MLARSAKLLPAVADALRQNGLRPYIAKRKQEFETPLLIFVHSALRLCGKPADFAQLASLCDAYGKLTGESVSAEEISAEATLNGGESLLRGFVAASRPSEYREAIAAKLMESNEYRDFATVVLDAARGCSAPEDQEIAVWKELDRQIQGNLGNATLSGFLQELDLRQKTSPASDDDIQCLTIHLAKGKERKHVYLMGLAKEQLPSYYAVRDGGAAIEEERRNCFVAITRAQETLTLTYARQYSGYAKEPSLFLKEMGCIQ